MSSIDCEACSNLVEYAPSFVQNGVTSSIAASLKNDTGFNPNLSSLHTNCEDLNDANDCLIGRKDAQLESYDVCEWKEFMHLLLPNMYELNKAIIAGDCGQWENIHDLWTRTDELCDMIGDNMSPPLHRYGVLPYMESHPERVVGTKSSYITITPEADVSQVNKEAVGIGINYGKKTYSSCSGSSCMVYEWVTPFFYETTISGSTPSGEVLWYAQKSDIVEATGMSDYFWYTFNVSSATWYDIPLIGDGRFGRVELNENPGGMGANYIGLIWRGTSYPRNVALTDTRITYGSSKYANLYRHSCNWVEPT